MNEKNSKWDKSVALLESALSRLRKEKDSEILFAAVSKAFEVSFEYAWKSFKIEADKAGLEVYSPRDAIKAAGQLSLIQDVELWNNFLNARNLSVHDYIGISQKQYLELVEQFCKEIKGLVKH